MNFRQIDFFLQKMDWLSLGLSICGLIMSANGPILKPSPHPFTHLGLSWPKSLIIGIGQKFFLVLENHLGKIIIFLKR